LGRTTAEVALYTSTNGTHVSHLLPRPKLKIWIWLYWAWCPGAGFLFVMFVPPLCYCVNVIVHSDCAGCISHYSFVVICYWHTPLILLDILHNIPIFSIFE